MVDQLTWTPDALGLLACTFVMLNVFCGGGVVDAVLVVNPAQPVRLTQEAIPSRAAARVKILRILGKA